LRLDACPVAQRSTAHQRSTTITTVLARRLPWCRRDLLTATGETAHRSVSTSDSWFVARACAPKVSVLSMISDMRKVWLRGRATARRSPCFSRVRGRRWVASSGIFRQVFDLGDDIPEGGTVGGTGPRARCSPLPCSQPSAHRERRRGGGRARGCSNCNQRRDLLTKGSGRRPLPPAPIRRRRRGGQRRYRGVSDHDF